MDQRGNMAPKSSSFETLAEGTPPTALDGEFAPAGAASTIAPRPEEEHEEDADSVQEQAGRVAEGLASEDKKLKSIAPNSKKKKSAPAKKGMAQGDGRALTLDQKGKHSDLGTPSGSDRKTYELLVKQFRPDKDSEFEAEPLASGVLAVLRSSGVSSKQDINEDKNAKRVDHVKSGITDRERKSAKTRMRKATAKSDDQSWSSKSNQKVPTTAFFALGRQAMADIKAAAKDRRLSFVTTSIESLAKDNSEENLGNLVTFEVDASQKEALLKKLRETKGLKLQLFGQTPLAQRSAAIATKPTKKVDAPKKGGTRAGSRTGAKKPAEASRAKGTPKSVTAGSASQSATPKANPAPVRFRISFIVLRP